MSDTFASSDLPEPNRIKPGGMMSDELSEVFRLCSILRSRSVRNAKDWEAADTIERLIRERDEARAKLDAWDGLKRQEANEAERRGYRRGVEDAAKAVEKTEYWLGTSARDAILALLDKEKTDA